ncbi:MAG TPA: branched-chain amino acid ABC transporter permease [Rhodopila sp.]|nr:branched-chain amino acid ABC transporter permease [Rhodopila sp.]
MPPQLLIGGLGTGCIYALVGLGFTLVYRGIRMVNFAQGQVFMAGTFLGLFLVQRLGLSAIPLLIAVPVISFATGWLLERAIFRHLFHSHEVFVVGAIGLGVMIENAIRAAFPEPLPFPKIFGSGVYRFIPGVLFQKTYLWIVVITVLLVLLLHILFAYTRRGRALRAVAADAEIAGTMGVSVSNAIGFTFGLSFAVAAIAGILIGPLYFVSPDMGDLVGLKAFSAAVLGGIDSVIGTILGGVMLGLIEAIAGFYLSTDYKDLFAFAILMLMLVVRPQGLLGRVVPVKV